MHTHTTNKDIKELFRNESLMAKKVTEVMLSGKYSNSLVLFPDSAWLANSDYMKHMSEAYAKIYKIQAFPPFFPLELLSFYPEIGEDFETAYKMEGHKIIDITGSLKERMDLFKEALLPDKPQIKLSKKNGKVEMILRCGPSVRGIMVFEIRNINKKAYATKYFAPYTERINLTNVLKIKGAEILSTEKLSYLDREWYLEGKKIQPDSSFIALICENNEGKYTSLSDIVSLRQ